MIHQLIFASPKPGMSEDEFQSYWVNVHAVNYASKIKEIKRYLIDTRIALEGDSGEPLFSGVAEIWLRNEKEQLESLQSKAFLEGARLDEPHWAAFWKTLVLDTDAHLLLDGPPLTTKPEWVKRLLLIKRKEGTTLADFRNYSLRTHAKLVQALPGLRRYMQCHVRDSYYAVGESRFDAVYQLWFNSVDDLQKAVASSEHKAVRSDMEKFVEQKYIFTMNVRENWIIGPEARD